MMASRTSASGLGYLLGDLFFRLIKEYHRRLGFILGDGQGWGWLRFNQGQGRGWLTAGSWLDNNLLINVIVDHRLGADGFDSFEFWLGAFGIDDFLELLGLLDFSLLFAFAQTSVDDDYQDDDCYRQPHYKQGGGPRQPTPVLVIIQD